MDSWSWSTASSWTVTPWFSLNEAPGWDAYKITDARLVAAGDGAAAIVYKAEATRGDEEPFEAVMSSTYTLVDGQPRLVLYQQTTTTH